MSRGGGGRLKSSKKVKCVAYIWMAPKCCKYWFLKMKYLFLFRSLSEMECIIFPVWRTSVCWGRSYCFWAQTEEKLSRTLSCAEGGCRLSRRAAFTRPSPQDQPEQGFNTTATDPCLLTLPWVQQFVPRPPWHPWHRDRHRYEVRAPCCRAHFWPSSQSHCLAGKSTDHCPRVLWAGRNAMHLWRCRWHSHTGNNIRIIYSFEGIH